MIRPALSFALLFLALPAFAQDTMTPLNPGGILAIGADQTEALKVNDHIYLAYGFGNTFMVTTSEGNVVIDTSLRVHANRAKNLLTKVSDAPVRYIILTHGHGDHTGGVALWKQADTKVIAQENHVEFLNYQHRLAGFFANRNSAQFQGQTAAAAPAAASAGNFAAEILADTLFDEEHKFSLGELTFELYHTPGETYDHLTVWIPELKAAFVGDNFYESFPNIYTLRGTEPRYALDYTQSIDKVLALKPEILLPSHGRPIQGRDEIARALTRYRDAILYVHDATVRGINDGKDVFTLMREIRLPAELEVGESYGNVPWSVRGIYEGYIGWFDGNPATMYDLPPAAVQPQLVELAGGPGPVAKRAAEFAGDGNLIEALHLADAALSADPNHREALTVRLNALQALFDKSNNSNERGWLNYGILQTKAKLDD